MNVLFNVASSFCQEVCDIFMDIENGQDMTYYSKDGNQLQNCQSVIFKSF